MEPNLEEMVEWRDGERAEGICLQFNSLRPVPPAVRSSSNCTTAYFPQLSSRTKFPAKSTSAPSRRLARIS